MRFLLTAALCLLALSPAANAQPVRFLAFGDSITTGQGDFGVSCFSPSSGGYPGRLANQLREAGYEIEMRNFGRCGEFTNQGLSRINQVLPVGGDVIFLMEGTNDLSAFTSLESMRFNLREMARKSEEAGITPVIASVIPRRFDSGHDTGNVRTSAFAGWLNYDATNAGRAFVDPFNRMIGLPNLFSSHYSDPWHPNPRGYDVLAGVFTDVAFELAEQVRRCTAAPCVADDDTLCLLDGRYRVEVLFETEEAESQAARVSPRDDSVGFFWFFDADNLELMVKMLDARSINGHVWVFYGALTNVGYTLEVVDSETGACRRYVNPPGRFASAGDTEAFALPTEPEGEASATEPGGEASRVVSGR